LSADAPQEEEKSSQESVDLSSLTSMLQARWKGGQGGGGGSKGEGPRSGQIRSFRIGKLDPATKKIELELV
jgi:small subunit ribosomal protein S1